MENEAFSIWTPHQAFYIQSMLFNTTSAIQACSIAEKIIKRISDGEIDPQEMKDILLNCMQNVVNQTGAISRYFFPSRDGSKGADNKNIHKDRGQYLSKVFDVKDDSPLMNRALRNSIEHNADNPAGFLAHGGSNGGRKKFTHAQYLRCTVAHAQAAPAQPGSFGYQRRWKTYKYFL